MTDLMGEATADHACHTWLDAVAHATVRATHTGRLAWIGSNSAGGASTLLQRCPWCNAIFYRDIGKSQVLTFAGWAHRRAAEAGWNQSRRSPPEATL